MHFYRVDFRELLITFSYQAHVLISTAEPNDLRFSKTLFLAVIICFPSQEISRKTRSQTIQKPRKNNKTILWKYGFNIN